MKALSKSKNLKCWRSPKKHVFAPERTRTSALSVSRRPLYQPELLELLYLRPEFLFDINPTRPLGAAAAPSTSSSFSPCALARPFQDSLQRPRQFHFTPTSHPTPPRQNPTTTKSHHVNIPNTTIHFTTKIPPNSTNYFTTKSPQTRQIILHQKSRTNTTKLPPQHNKTPETTTPHHNTSNPTPN